MSYISANSITQRQMLKTHRMWGKKYGINPQDIRPQTLLLYAKLASDKDTYYFDTTEKATSVSPIERRLRDSSLMFVNLFGLGLLKAPIVSSAEYPAGSPIVSYPDKTIFNGAAGTNPLSEAQALELWYHGTLSFETDQTKRLDNFPTEVFRYAPDTQSGAAAHPSQGAPLFDIATSFFLWGDRGNQFSLRVPINGGNRGMIAGTAGSNQNYGVLLLGGFEVVNAANANRVKDFASFVEEKMR